MDNVQKKGAFFFIDGFPKAGEGKNFFTFKRDVEILHKSEQVRLLKLVFQLYVNFLYSVDKLICIFCGSYRGDPTLICIQFLSYYIYYIKFGS